MNHLILKITEENAVYKKNSKILECNYRHLKKRLSKAEKRLLLSMIDEKDLMIETAAFKNFEKGFCIGIQLAFDVFSKS